MGEKEGQRNKFQNQSALEKNTKVSDSFNVDKF